MPDESALFSVLQFGAIVPPLSPWRGVSRFLPGHRYSGTQLVGVCSVKPTLEATPPSPEQQADRIEQLLDADLKHALRDGRRAVLLFSGGVDSALIASRLANFEARGVLLLNYCFGSGDPESQVAQAMAKSLGLDYECISAERDVCVCLENPGQVYPQPFADQSTVPTSELAYAATKRLAGNRCVILDGTGADGGFGLGNKLHTWGVVERIPALVRRMVSSVYGKHFWHKPGQVERLTRILRRSVEMPFVSAVIAQNPLAGILYHRTSEIDVHALLAKWTEGWVNGSRAQNVVAADLALACANVFAQKGLPILRAAGHKVHYPFLQPEIVALALGAAQQWRMEEPKAALKISLARRIPPEMVYRPKSGFVDGKKRVFSSAKFLTYFRAAAEPTSPIASVLKIKRVIKACDMLCKGHRLPEQTLNCIWAITFMDRWYRTALPFPNSTEIAFSKPGAG